MLQPKIDLLALLRQLQESPSAKDNYSVLPLPGTETHKLGIDDEGRPIFFIECGEGNKTDIDVNLKYFSALFNRECLISENGVSMGNKVYTLVHLKTTAEDLLKYFLEVVYLVILSLPSKPNNEIIRNEIANLVSLFSKFSKKPTKTIQGLWAELLVLERSKDPEYLVKAWHSTPLSKYDFNDAQDKVEVKSTSKPGRSHSFAIEQLNPNPGSRLLVASVQVIETGTGKNIFDLKDMIFERVADESIRLLVTQSIADTLGNSIEEAIGSYFDYQMAKDTLAYFDYHMIPRISLDVIPACVSQVRFTSDLSDVEPVKESWLEEVDSVLFNSL